MYKNLLVLAIALFAVNLGFSQDEDAPARTKTMGGEGNLSFASTGFGDYYSGGGLGSTTINGILNTYLNNTYENGGIWDNNLRLDYGVAKVENTNDENFTKASDVVDFVSKYGTPVKGSEKWYYSAAFNLLTQLTDTRTAYAGNNAYTPLIGVNNNIAQTFGTNQSSLFAPADISLGLGFDYKPNDNFSAFIGPLSGKVRVVGNDDIAQSGLFGNDVTIVDGLITDFEKTRFEAGTSALANYNNSFLTDDMLSFTTGLKLFSNYLEDPQNVDVNWNTMTSLNPWKFVTITYATDMAYDDNKQFTAYANGEPTGGVKKGIQFRNVLGLGLVHKFGDSKE